LIDRGGCQTAFLAQVCHASKRQAFITLRDLIAMQPAQNASREQARQQSLALLNQHLAAAVILQDRMRRSPRSFRGANVIVIDDTCDEVASLMEACTMRIAERLQDLGGTVRWPVLLDDGLSDQGLRRSCRTDERVIAWPDTGPLDAFGQSVLDAVSVAAAYGDTTTAEVMEQIWRGVDRQLWKAFVQKHARQ
jgi:starvation-inducible DNA-binding protein